MRLRRRLVSLHVVAAILCICAVARAQQKIPIQIALGDVEIQKVPFQIALDQGIYAKNGLDADVFYTTGAADFARRSGVNVPANLVKSDEAAILISGGTPLTVGVVTDIRNWDRVILATTDPVVHWSIIARPDIKRVEDLKGKRIGFSGVGAMTHYIALSLCKRMGWDPVFDVSMMAGALTVDGLQTGRVDAIIGDNLHGTMARAAGFPVLFNLTEWKMPIAGSGVRTTKTWVRENREAARRFTKSMVEAIALFKKDPNVAYESMKKWWGITDIEKLKAMYADAATLPRKPYPSIEGIKTTMQIYDSHEMRRHKPEDFFDASFIKELDDNGYIDSLYK
ncbi:MAG: ABC transporter substrate-binding protein [Acidobacteria bacterium]|nr:ABC transporter substrate-binding protein [Acidobacteriota bacterium]